MRILLVSYHLYPDPTAEGICVSKWARAMKDAGHEITIVTSTKNELNGSFCIPETSVLSGIPVHRVAADSNEPPRWSRPLYAASAMGARAGRVGIQTLGRLDAVPNLIFGCRADERAWVHAAGRTIVRLCTDAQAPFDVIHSRLNHFSSHLAVMEALPEISQRPAWSAHFSDPWPHHLYPGVYRSSVGPLSRWRLEGLLDRMLAGADSLTFPADRLMHYMLQGDRKKHLAKAFAGPHLGNFWMPKTEASRAGRLQILFVGFLWKQRDPTVLFKAMQQLFQRDPSAREHLSVRFVGKANEKLIATIRERGLESVVSLVPHEPYERAWARMGESHVLLLLESLEEDGIFMRAKLADYISAERPILALAHPSGTVADFLAESGGLRVNPDSPDHVADALAELLGRWKADTLDELKPSPALVRQVSPAGVVPIYEAAFREAVKNVAHATPVGAHVTAAQPRIP